MSTAEARAEVVDARLATEFFSVLFDGCDGVIELRGFSKDSNVVNQCFNREPAALRGWLTRHADTNLYMGVATRRDATSGALANCRHLGALFVDLDFKDTSELAARARLKECPLPPSLLVQSGGGLHVYWLLREPFALPRDTDRAKTLLPRLAAYLGGDPASAEPARILRVPGRWNRKSDYPARRLVRLELCQPTRRYNPLEFDGWLPSEPTTDAAHGRFAMPEQVRDGKRNTTLYRAARSMYAKGFPEAAVAAALNVVNQQKCAPPLPMEELRDLVAHAAQQPHTTAFSVAPASPANGTTGAAVNDAPWARAVSVPDFLAQEEHEVAWLEEDVLAPGSLTEIFAPRGLGKSHVLHGILVKLARRGTRCLLLDRDNSRREVKRRLRAWGARDLPALRVMLRDDVPPLTDTKAWAQFPFAEYDVVAIDSLDASAEGVGEQDSAKPSRALAPILDLCHRAAGPAIVTLGNVIKSGAHSRGSGVVEDRADIAYEVRDCTDLTPSGAKDWWQELPPAGAEHWQARASRRKRRDTYRLAFVPSKFRIGEEPEPFAYELNLGSPPWSLRLCTEEILTAGREAQAMAKEERQTQLAHAAAGLVASMTARAQGGADPMISADAEDYLKAEHHLRRADARALLTAQEGILWSAHVDAARPGRPKFLQPIAGPPTPFAGAPAAEIPRRETTALTPSDEGEISADRMDRARQKYGPTAPRINSGDSKGGISAAAPDLKGAPAAGEDRL